ncbi:MAG: hypothetical protein HMLIMOIP_001910 [Candidatus Nitrosomirales archaeon]|jgi:hypothetical protein
MKSILESRNYSLLILTSIILLIVTIGSTAFYQFPPNALYYAQSLPAYYWIGVSITLISIIVSYKVKINNHLKLVPHVILAAYLFSLPSFTYENPRFMDVYFHGSGALSIIRSGSINDHPYSEDYPLAFILMATNILITGIDPGVFLKVFQAFMPLLMIVLVYVFSRSLAPRYALYTPLAFNAMFFQDQGHFSPQAFALPLYLILLAHIGKLLLNKDINRQSIVISVIMLVAINLSNPTTSYFLLMNLASIVLLAALLIKFVSPKVLAKDTVVFSGLLKLIQSNRSNIPRNRHNSNIRKKLIPILLLQATLLFSWSLYSADNRGIDKMIDKLGADFTRFEESSAALPLRPSSSYEIVINVAAIATLFINISSFVFLAFLFKYKQSDMRIVLILCAMIVGSIVIMPIGLFQSGTFFQRVIMYTMIPWSVLFAVFMIMNIKSRWYTVTRATALITVLMFIMLIPVTKYGSEPTSYADSSEIYLADFLTKNGSENLVMTLRTAEFLFKYYGEYNDNDIKTARIASKTVFDKELVENTLDSKIQKRDLAVVALTNVENNIYSLKYPSDQRIYIDYLQERFNLIINNGAQVYTTLRE